MVSKRMWLLLMAMALSAFAVSCSTPTTAPTNAPAAQPTTTLMPESSPTPVPPTDVPASTATPEPTLVPPTATTEPSTPTTMPETSIDNGMMWEADGVVTNGEYADQVDIAGVTFAWTTDTEFLYGAMWAETEGWVAVAFDPTNRMQGANYIFGFVQNGEVSIADMFGTKPAGPDSHPPDTTLGGTDDIVTFGGSEADGVTLIEFKIPRDSGDQNDKPLTPGVHILITAFGPTDDFGTIHTSRGYGEITLGE